MSSGKKTRGRVDLEALLRPVTISLFIILLSFFILLNSLGRRAQEKEDAVFKSLSRSFGGPSVIREEGEGVYRLPQVDPEAIVDLRDLEKALVKSGSLVNFIYDRNKATIVMGEDLLFAGGDYRLVPGSEESLSRIAEVMSRTGYPVDIAGYTDNVPPREGSRFSNRELSALRAVSVLRYFTTRSGIGSDRFTAYGWGGEHPMMPNTTAESRKLNRRLEISFVHRGKQEKRGVFIFKDFFFRVFE